jgi:hypothetical protein
MKAPRHPTLPKWKIELVRDAMRLIEAEKGCRVTAEVIARSPRMKPWTGSKRSSTFTKSGGCRRTRTITRTTLSLLAAQSEARHGQSAVSIRASKGAKEAPKRGLRWSKTQRQEK